MINPLRAAFRFFLFLAWCHFSLFLNSVQTVSEGSAAFILSTGYGVRASRTAWPPFEPPIDLRTRINGTAPRPRTHHDFKLFGARLSTRSKGYSELLLRVGAKMWLRLSMAA